MKSLLLSLTTTALLLTSFQASAVDSETLTVKLSGLFYQDISEGYILSFQSPDYIDTYKNSDGTQIYLFKTLFTFPIFSDDNSFDLGGNEEALPAIVGQETKCEYVKYVEVEDDFTYGGPCTQKLEDVTDGALFDEGLIDQN